MNKHNGYIGLILIILVSACQAPPSESSKPTGATSQVTSTATNTQAGLTEMPDQVTTPLTVTETATPEVMDLQALLAYTEQKILRSSDSGESWEDITPVGLQRELVAESDGFGATLKADFCGDFGLAAISQTNQALVYRTVNGGITWEENVVELTEEAQGIVSLEVLGEQYGWLLVSRGVGAGNEWVDLYATQDSGVTWSHISWSSTQADPFGRIPSGGLKSGIRFSDPQTGWISGSAPIESIYLYRSLDGGETWQELRMPLPEQVAMPGTSSPPEFFTEDVGVIGVTVYTYNDTTGVLFFWTTDGGESWQPSTVLEGNITAWDWLDELHGYAGEVNEAGQNRLHITKDGGLSWESYSLDLAYLQKLEFVTEQVGWAICGWGNSPWSGCAGDLYLTQDSGASWEMVTP